MQATIARDSSGSIEGPDQIETLEKVGTHYRKLRKRISQKIKESDRDGIK